MKRWLAILLLAFVIGSAFLQTKPVYAALGSNSVSAGPLTFHVVNVFGHGTYPTDSPDVITYANGDGAYSYPDQNWTQLYLQNLCGEEGDTCSPRDIYIKVEMQAQFTSFYVETPALQIEYGPFNGIGPIQTYSNPCNMTVVSHGIWPASSQGDCSLTFNDVIPAADIDWSNTDSHEYAKWRLNNQYASFAMAFSVTFSTYPISTSCSDSYLTGAKWADITVPANSAAGVALFTGSQTGYPRPGTWMEVKVAGGSWQDETAPTLDRYDLAIKRSSVSSWESLEDSVYTNCYDPNNHKYYFQVTNTETNMVRVNDTGGNFAANTGSLTLELYTLTSYTPLPSSCENQFRKKDLLESNTVMANSTIGVPIGTGISADNPYSLGGETPGGDPGENRFMILEVTGGPYWDGSAYSTASEIVDSGIAYPTNEWPVVVCVTPLDTMGKVRIIFQYSDVMARMKPNNYLIHFRASDPDRNRGNNNGTIGYALYYADSLVDASNTDPGEFPDSEGCPNYSHAASGTAYTITSSFRPGYTITNLSVGSIYAVETSAGPWSNNGTNSYDVAISDDNGTTWTNMYAYAGLLCSKAIDGNHYVVYFQTIAGRTYKLRAYDEDDSYSNNTGTITATIYGVTAPASQWSPCSTSYPAVLMNIPDNERTVPAQTSQGVSVGSMLAGEMYGLEVTNEKQWMNTLAPWNVLTYEAEVSNDNGATWKDMGAATWATCTVIVSDETDATHIRYRIYFFANGNYRIRVKDKAPHYYASNLYWLMFRLYHVPATNANPGPDQPPPTDPNVPPSWGLACSSDCRQPTSIFTSYPLQVPGVGTFNLPLIDGVGWTEYGRCQLQKYLAWCPEHSAALSGAANGIMDRYPFSYIGEVANVYDFTNQTINSYSWGTNATGGEVGGGLSQNPDLMAGGGAPADQANNAVDMMLPVLDSSSPWNGGSINFTPLSIGGEDSNCSSWMSQRFGSTVSNIYCQATTLLINTPQINQRMAFYFDFGSTILFIMWIINYVDRLIGLLEKF
jgi:hypothetical protein